jgi:hypothetical protein
MVTMEVVKEKLIIGVLGLLLVGALAAPYFDYETAVWVARSICVVLTLLFVVGIWFPARRYLARVSRKTSDYPDRSPDSPKKP